MPTDVQAQPTLLIGGRQVHAAGGATFEIRVGQDHDRVLAAQFQRHGLD